MTADSSNVAALAVRDDSEVTGTALIRPAADLSTIKEAFDEYQRLRMQLLDKKEDFQRIGKKSHPKKSAWRKLSTAFGVSLSIVTKEHTRDERGRIVRSEFVCRATASNGRYSDGWGLCDLHEKCCEPGCTKEGNHKHCPAHERKECSGFRHFSHAEHDIPATAETRAKNRAASDLFGMGEVSAEEILGAGEVHDGAGDYIEGEVVEEQSTPGQRPSGKPGQDPNKLKTAIFNHPKFKELKGKPGWSIAAISKLSPADMAARLEQLQGKPAQPKPAQAAPEPAPEPVAEPEPAERDVATLRETIESTPGWKEKFEAIYGAVVEAAVMGNDPDSLNDVLAHIKAEAPAET